MRTMWLLGFALLAVVLVVGNLMMLLQSNRPWKTPLSPPHTPTDKADPAAGPETPIDTDPKK